MVTCQAEPSIRKQRTLASRDRSVKGHWYRSSACLLYLLYWLYTALYCSYLLMNLTSNLSSSSPRDTFFLPPLLGSCVFPSLGYLKKNIKNRITTTTRYRYVLPKKCHCLLLDMVGYWKMG